MMKKNILIPFKYLAMLGIALSLTFLTNCSDDDDVVADDDTGSEIEDTTDNTGDGGDVATLNIIESLQAAGGYDTLLYLINYYEIDSLGTKLSDVLATAGPFTLFAPNNDAFAALYDVVGVAKAADVSPVIIGQLLGYHGALGIYNPLSSDTPIITVQGENIIVNDGTTAASDGSIPEAGTLLTGSNTKNITVAGADSVIIASNGAIYNVGTVLIPPTVGAQLAAILQTNAASLLISDGLSIMGNAVRAADGFALDNELPSLVAYLSNRDLKSTVFAIPNVVFEGAGLGVETFSPAEWYGLISHHVVSGASAYAATDDKDSVLYAEYLVGENWPAAGKSVSSNLVVGQTEAGDKVNAQLHIQYLEGVGSYSSVFIDSDGHAGNGYTAADEGFFNAEVLAADFQLNTNGVVHLIAGYLAPSVDCRAPGLGCFANFNGTFGGATIDSTGFTFPTGAEVWAGFANNNKSLYPYDFPNGGVIMFKASPAVATDSIDVVFKFENKPNMGDASVTEPSFFTDTVTISADEDEYLIDIPVQDAGNTYSSFILYLIDRDIAVDIHHVDVKYGANFDPLAYAVNPVEGVWSLALVDGALAVGPSPTDLSWYSITLEQLLDRDCQYDDLYMFGEGEASMNTENQIIFTGPYTMHLDSATWRETWQGVDEGCGLPVAPHDGLATDYTYMVNTETDEVTLIGKGAYFGISKVYNGAELTSPADAPDQITYQYVGGEDEQDDHATFHIKVANPGGEGGFATWQIILQHLDTDDED